MLKGLGDMMKQVQAMQQRAQELQVELERTEIAGSAGGGLISMTLNGKNELKRVAIDPSLMKPKETEILSDLLVAAHHDAKQKVKAQITEQMQKLTGDLPLPPGFKLP